MKLKMLLYMILFLLFTTSLFAAQATLSWSPNSESDLAGYKVYHGKISKDNLTFADYEFMDDVGRVTSYTVTGLIEGETYFFAATAYDFSSNESGYSNEVSYDVPITSVPDTMPLAITSVSIDAYEIVENGLQNGALVYIDRAYTYSTIPTSLQGTTYIKTANADKALSDASFLTFEVNQDVTVYVAQDDRITTKPSWLSSFTDTGDNLVTTDTTLSIFASNYLAGTITLGSNEGGGYSMYTVVIVGKGTVDDVPIIIDDVPPVIVMLGEEPMTIERNTPYIEEGATASDNVDGDITSSIITTGNVDALKTGVYLITYTVADSFGNIATATRTVIVEDTVAPDWDGELRINLDELSWNSPEGEPVAYFKVYKESSRFPNQTDVHITTYTSFRISGKNKEWQKYAVSWVSELSGTESSMSNSLCVKYKGKEMRQITC